MMVMHARKLSCSEVIEIEDEEPVIRIEPYVTLFPLTRRYRRRVPTAQRLSRAIQTPPREVRDATDVYTADHGICETHVPYSNRKKNLSRKRDSTNGCIITNEDGLRSPALPDGAAGRNDMHMSRSTGAASPYPGAPADSPAAARGGSAAEAADAARRIDHKGADSHHITRRHGPRRDPQHALLPAELTHSETAPVGKLDDDSDGASSAWESDDALSWPEGGRWLQPSVPSYFVIVPPEELLVPPGTPTPRELVRLPERMQGRQSPRASKPEVVRLTRRGSTRARQSPVLKARVDSQGQREKDQEEIRKQLRAFNDTYQAIRDAAAAEGPHGASTRLPSKDRLLQLRYPLYPHPSLLAYAISRNNLPVFQLLAAQVPELLTVTDVNGSTVIHETAFRNRPDILKLILRKRPELLNQRNRDGRTPLALSVTYGKYEVVDFLASQEGGVS